MLFQQSWPLYIYAIDVAQKSPMAMIAMTAPSCWVFCCDLSATCATKRPTFMALSKT